MNSDGITIWEIFSEVLSSRKVSNSVEISLSHSKILPSLV